MTADIIDINHADLEEAGQRIRDGAVFVYPTDTVYGLGCDALNEEAVGRIFEVKGRGLDKPLSVAFSDLDQLLEFVEVDEEQKMVMGKRLPGPYTFIVPNIRIPKIVTAGLDTVGVRVPDYSLVRELIKKAKTPIVTTSANKSGGKAPCSVNEVDKGVLGIVDFALDGGACGSGKPSKIINLVTGERLR